MSFAKEIAKDAPREQMQEVAPLVRRPVNVKPKALYPEIGVRSFGRGTFHKAPLRGSDITWKTIFHIEPGDPIFSNLMAWEGAVAVAKPADAGFVGSYRFLSCVPKPEKATPEFLCQWFLTEEGIFQLREGSPSSIKRNRTLSKTNLMAIPVPVPPLPKQKEFTALRRQVQSARALHADLPAELDALQSALLDQAFRGEL